jgi:hypothetical protein
MDFSWICYMSFRSFVLLALCFFYLLCLYTGLHRYQSKSTYYTRLSCTLAVMLMASYLAYIDIHHSRLIHDPVYAAPYLLREQEAQRELELSARRGFENLIRNGPFLISRMLNERI